MVVVVVVVAVAVVVVVVVEVAIVIVVVAEYCIKAYCWCFPFKKIGSIADSKDNIRDEKRANDGIILKGERNEDAQAAKDG